MCMSADDAQWRICADDAYLMRRCAFGLYDAHIRMCAAAHYAVMRIISVRICAYYAHIIRRCAYYAHMRMCFVDAHNMHICSYYAHIIR